MYLGLPNGPDEALSPPSSRDSSDLDFWLAKYGVLTYKGTSNAMQNA